MLTERIRIDAGGVQSGLNQAQNAVKNFGSQVKSTIAGAFGGAAFVSAVRRTLQDIDQISDAAEEMNMPVEQIQALKYASEDASDSFEKLLSILTKIEDVQIDIIKGESAQGRKGREVLAKYGINPQDINTSGALAKLMARDDFDRNDINTLIGAKMANKFMPYRGHINAMDANVSSGMGGRVKSQSELDEIQVTVAKGKQIWDELWNSIFYSLSKIATILASIFRWFNNSIPDLGQGKYGGPTTLLDVTGPATVYRLVSNVLRNLGITGKGKSKPTDTTNTPLVDPNDILGSGKGYTDSLLTVGNFLGSATANMSIATSILDENKKQTEALNKIVENTSTGTGANYMAFRGQLML